MSASRERLLWADVDVGMFTVPEELLRPWVYDLEAFILELTGLGLVSCWALRIASLIFRFVAKFAGHPSYNFSCDRFVTGIMQLDCGRVIFILTVF